MSERTFTCPRCFFTAPARSDARFCPHCGLEDPQAASEDRQPLDVTVGDTHYRVEDRIAIGSICNIYRCRFREGLKQVEAIFKIAREPQVNGLVVNEGEVLRRLHSLESAKRYTPFLPTVQESCVFSDDHRSSGRQANILRMHPDIASPVKELYALAEIRSAYPSGIDARDMAWIWRRVLSVIGFAHAQQIVHCAVLPMHILIEPKDHKLILIDWCDAVTDFRKAVAPPAIINGGYMQWYRHEQAANTAPRPALDIAFGARCMIDILGGDAISLEMPASVDPAIQRHLTRCIGDASRENLDAWKLLEDFDRLIEVLWGPRVFRQFSLPPK